jgi:hypothetical protein
MAPWMKFYFYMDGVFSHTYFYYKHYTDSSSFDGEYYDPRDVDGIIIH